MTFRKPRKTIGRRGFKVDPVATAARGFKDRRSFVSVDGHELLVGAEDTTARRKEIFERSHGRCELHVAPGCKGFVNWHSRGMEGWAHLDVEPHRNHCDCAANGAAACDKCHRWFHAHSKLAREIIRRRNEAAKEFIETHGMETL